MASQTKTSTSDLAWDHAVLDIAIPYEENWRFLQLLMSSESMNGRKVVITTTNKRALEQLIGQKTEAHELVGKPYDLQAIVDAVQRAAGRTPAKH